MIRTGADCATESGAIKASAARSGWMKGSLYVLLCAAAALATVPASAADKRSETRAARHVERLDRRQSKGRDVPRNARYKNPPRGDRAGRETRVSSWDRSGSNDRRHGRHGRSDERAHHRERGHDDHARRHDHHRGKHDGRHHYGKPHHHHHHKHRYRTRVYHHYEYVPYYAPAVVAYPYYCDLCHSGFYAEHLFYDHLCHVHRLTLALIPGLLHWYGGTFFFFGLSW
jgi:hypothetical protein